MNRSFLALLGLLLAAGASTPLLASSHFSATGSLQFFGVTTTGLYELTAFGAQGGSISSNAGGDGAEVQGLFELNQNDVLSIYVGVEGGSLNSVGAGGGGGGTFIVLNGSILLMVAGGGGGASPSTNGIGGVTTQLGAAGTGTGGASSLENGGSGGTGSGSGGGGGGYNSDGTAGTGTFSGSGGIAFVNGLFGGAGSSESGSGGYGGGGGAGNNGGNAGGGGGGGYSGGGGGGGNNGAGGGGGSFVDASVVGAPILIASADIGDGGVDVDGPFAPEPASAAFLGIGLFGQLALRRLGIKGRK